MKRNASRNPAYSLGPSGEFVIDDYNAAKPFASFFPGIAGPHGIPMWVFYVNRGQCICSMGIEDKEHPIMEFLSANRAYQLASTQGFRTFVKIRGRGPARFYEPFQQQVRDAGMNRTQKMIILPAELGLEETNETLGLRFSVEYFNVPGDTYAGLVRVLRITNLGRRPARLEVLDGLPLIIPYGVDNYNLKHMRRLVESFVEVVNYERGLPYFKSKVKQEDRPEVTRIKEGNFYMGFLGGRGGVRRVRPVVDPETVFGNLTDYSYPERFLAPGSFRMPAGQILENRIPCALGLFQAALPAGGSVTYCTLTGTCTSVAELNRLARRILTPKYVEKKRAENRDLVDRLTQNNYVHSRSRPFDLYCRQNFLDNTLRGGLPLSLHDDRGVTTVHLYSRKHGDLERDYNDYRLSATNYSQGNGNFRDVNQNRRCDLLINPDVGTANLEHFYNLIQLDGFNPLIVKPTSFSVRRRKDMEGVLRRALRARDAAAVRGFLRGRFTPGQLMSFLAERGIRPRVAPDAFVGRLLGACARHQETDIGHGFWSDHWTYNLDLLENYLAVFPEKLRQILFGRRTFTFFDNPDVVLPRDEKYQIWDGRPMQLGAVARDQEKARVIRERANDAHEVRAEHGRGEIYRTTLINKMLSLVLNKLASLDPAGVGIEMESDKPNWYDALNGLPGQMGSSISETIELKRLVLFMLNALETLEGGATWPLYEEAAAFMKGLDVELRSWFGRKGGGDFAFWDRATALKEAYRAKTRLGVSGGEKTVSVREVRGFLGRALKKLDAAIRRAWDPKRKIIRTYFINKVTRYEPILEKGPGGRKKPRLSRKGLPCFRARRFKQVPLPLFLEGPVHYLRVERNAARSRDLVRRVRTSGLYDRKLDMYKVNECLDGQPLEIGRTRIFSRGWLENESIWLHMEYKYLLELLRSGLHDEFYRDFRKVLVPFLDPAMYGRSILENSSFIASSANPDPALHGNGFVARLSGSTAEFIHILLLMTVGEKPFRLDVRGRLELRFAPALPSWLFTTKAERVPLWIGGRKRTIGLPAGTFSFSFLGGTIVTYHNPKQRDTFGPRGVRPRRWTLTDGDGKVHTVEGGAVGGVLARQVRDRRIARIDVELG